MDRGMLCQGLGILRYGEGKLLWERDAMTRVGDTALWGGGGGKCADGRRWCVKGSAFCFKRRGSCDNGWTGYDQMKTNSIKNSSRPQKVPSTIGNVKNSERTLKLRENRDFFHASS